MARQLTAKEAASKGQDTDGVMPVKLNDGIVRYMELDAEKMGDFFNKATFNAVWISEAMSHLPDKELFSQCGDSAEIRRQSCSSGLVQGGRTDRKANGRRHQAH